MNIDITVTYRTTQTTFDCESQTTATTATPEPAPAGAVARAYARVAPIYDLVFGKVLESGRRALAAAASAHAPATLLEVGVGSGLTLPHYPAGTHVTGIDLSEAMLERARAQAARLSSRQIELRRLNAEQMPFPSASFDVVTVPYVLPVTPDPARLVREIRRVCKPHGTIVLVNHFSDGRVWTFIERVVRPIMSRVGVNNAFLFADQILSHDWEVISAHRVDPLGLSTLVEIRNQARPAAGPGAQSGK